MKKWIWLIAFFAAVSFGEDWYTWRGPDANGISKETGIDGSVAATVWTKELGVGYSAVSVKEGRLYTMGHTEKQDTVFCLDALSGEEIWSHTYACKTGNFKGPRATPVVNGEAVYIVSREGQVFCFDVKSGAVNWSTDVLDETGLKNITWGISSSVVAEGDLLLIGIGAAGIALNSDDGKIIWESGGAHSYATPVVFDLKGERVAAIFSQPGLKIVDVYNGKVLAELEWETKHDINGADPVLIGDKLFITSGYGRGCAMLDASGDALKILWENTLMNSHFSSSLLLDGFLYGVDAQAGKKGSLRCLSAKDGSEQWSAPLGHGSLIAADGQLIVLTDDGTLYFVKASPKAYKELVTFDTGIGKLCWTAPVLANGMLYCRNEKGSLIAVRVK